MDQQVLIDTDILIDFGRDKSNAIQTISKLEEDYQICLSAIVIMELYAGCRSKKELKEVDELINGFTVYHITSTVSDTALQWMRKYRSKYGVEINDMLIAATAHSNNLRLISKNQKHYKFLSEIDLLDYPIN